VQNWASKEGDVVTRKEVPVVLWSDMAGGASWIVDLDAVVVYVVEEGDQVVAEVQTLEVLQIR